MTASETPEVSEDKEDESQSVGRRLADAPDGSEVDRPGPEVGP